MDVLAIVLVTMIEGGDALPHLASGVGARELAMGGAGSVACSTATASSYNPASLARLRGGSLVLFKELTSAFSDAYAERGDGRVYAAWAQALPRVATLSVSVDQFKLGGIEYRTGETRDPLGEFGYEELVGSVAAAARLFAGFSVGSGLVLYHQRFCGVGAAPPLEGMSSWGGAGSAGLEYCGALPFRVGIATRLPARLTWAGADTGYAADRVAARSTLSVAFTPAPSWLVGLDVSTRHNRAFVGSIGAEWRMEFPALCAAARAGIRDWGLGSEVVPTPAVTGGFGLAYRRGTLNIGVDLAASYRFAGLSGFYPSLSVTIGY